MYLGRKESRESAMRLLFEIGYNMDEKEDILNRYLDNNTNKLSSDDYKYIKDIVSGAMGNLSAIDLKIEQYSRGWKVNRISKIDLAILRLAVYELLYTDIPDGVAINEAVELAKSYGEEKSSSFVNGILASVSQNAKH
jgi:N utilization substance protein B